MIFKCHDCESEFNEKYAVYYETPGNPRCPVCGGYVAGIRPADLPEAGASAECISSVVHLLPCPFCGGHANLMIEIGEHYIRCMMCYTTTGWKDNEESAIKAWNTRQ